MDRIDFNLIVRNMPGWQQEITNLQAKAYKAKEDSKPVITPVKEVIKSKDTYLDMKKDTSGNDGKEVLKKQKISKEKLRMQKVLEAAVYDVEGSKIRNDLRQTNMYDSNGMKKAL